MNNYNISIITKNDLDKVLDIYNSNIIFLKNHLGISNISRNFLISEIEKMKDIGFKSFIIKNSFENIVGICDFSIGSDVYLSLLMIDGNQKRNGLGSKIYNELEQFFKTKNVKGIRIDVVYGYEENVVSFWEKQGFTACEKIQIEWSGHKSSAIKMYKSL